MPPPKVNPDPDKVAPPPSKDRPDGNREEVRYVSSETLIKPGEAQLVRGWDTDSSSTTGRSG